MTEASFPRLRDELLPRRRICSHDRESIKPGDLVRVQGEHRNDDKNANQGEDDDTQELRALRREYRETDCKASERYCEIRHTIQDDRREHGPPFVPFPQRDVSELNGFCDDPNRG